MSVRLIAGLCVALLIGAGCDGRILIDAIGGPGGGPDGGSLADGGSDAGSDAGNDPATACAPLPPPTGTIQRVRSGVVADFAAATAVAQPGDTILVEDGTYSMNGTYILITTPGVTLRSESGNRDAVVIDGMYSTSAPQIISVGASNITVADLTIKRAYTHAIHVSTSFTNAGDMTNIRIHNVHVIDPAEQGIKVNSNGTFDQFIDNSEISCSRIELTSAGRPQIRNSCYTGGIDVHAGRNWRVHDNVIEGFWCASGLSEHGIHFWKGPREVIAERNVLRNNARGIGFGLGDATVGRVYVDAVCAGNTIGSTDCVARNNMLLVDDPALFASASGADTGIALEKPCGGKIVHNTVAFTQSPFSAIEWRFSTGVAIQVTNNLTTHRQLARDGATALEQGNIANTPTSSFVSIAGNDLHLAAGAAAPRNAGVPAAADAAEDLDREPRSTTAPDVGADEVP